MKNQAVQTIKNPGGDELVLLPKADYDLLLAAARDKLEDEIDMREAARVLGRLERGEEQTLPHDVVKRLRRENAVKVFREHRGMTQKRLAEKAGLSPLYVSQIETGREPGGLAALTKIAKALDVTIDLIAPRPAVEPPILRTEPIEGAEDGAFRILDPIPGNKRRRIKK